ncbi:MAG: hypothetical protein HN403_17315 [Rhodospirillales bacterium]|jgi:hypothetical protein|nr:hypothetical protein [Rhodospirillales bacterium]
MSEDPQEVAAFKATLSKASTEEITKLLDDGVIARPWKRELAKADVARRIGEKDAPSASKTPNQTSIKLKSWAITILLIACAILVAAILLLM